MAHADDEPMRDRARKAIDSCRPLLQAMSRPSGSRPERPPGWFAAELARVVDESVDMRLDPEAEGHLRAAVAALERRLAALLLCGYPQPVTEHELRLRIARLRAELDRS